MELVGPRRRTVAAYDVITAPRMRTKSGNTGRAVRLDLRHAVMGPSTQPNSRTGVRCNPRPHQELTGNSSGAASRV